MGDKYLSLSVIVIEEGFQEDFGGVPIVLLIMNYIH